MIYNNLEFFNVVELGKSDVYPGLKLQRYPLEVRKGLELNEAQAQRGSFVGQEASGCEIRFVTDAKTVRIALSSTVSDGEVVVLKGDYVHSIHRLHEGVIKTIHLDEPQRFKEIKREILFDSVFSPDVWRICTGSQNIIFHGAEAFGDEIRPPKKDELPALTWLAYGSSITQGAGAFNYYNSYIQHTARRLGVAAINLGLGGACRLEKGVADFIAGRKDWDFATLELGVNIRGQVSSDEFLRRSEYLISNMLEQHPDKPVAVITMYPNWATYLETPNGSTHFELEFNEILRNIVARFNHKNLFLIEGHEIMSRPSYLTCDVIHPNDFGHAVMGEKLSIKLSDVLRNCGMM